jgi:hypothetical protein
VHCPFRMFFVRTGYAGCIYPFDSIGDIQKIVCSPTTLSWLAICNY